jgi:hypothetical protein
MATATSRRAPPDKKAGAERRMLAQELLGIHRRLKADFDRIDVIEAALKRAATDAGGSFREEFDGQGRVSVSPAQAAEFKGNVPVIQTEAWLELKPAERKDLEKRGLVKVKAQWGRPAYGRVAVKLF